MASEERVGYMLEIEGERAETTVWPDADAGMAAFEAATVEHPLAAIVLWETYEDADGGVYDMFAVARYEVEVDA